MSQFPPTPDSDPNADLDPASALINLLNDAQREAVCAPLGNRLILAGAGSGKTRVLIYRMAWLMQIERISPYSMLAVTFTNKAANEMRARLMKLLRTAENSGQPRISAYDLWVGTFHGLAHRLLRQHWQEAGLLENFQIIDSEDQSRIVRKVMKALELDEKNWPPKQAQWFINQCKDEARRPHDLDNYDDVFERTMKQVYKNYQETCERNGLVDFAELLLRVHELWVQNPHILADYQRRFQHILVDEFQDTNTIQYLWLQQLAGAQAHVFAVGDDDQSIYGWRGAKVTNLHHFQQDFPEVQLTKLEQNYRSTGTILEAANRLIGNNPGRLGKNLWTDGEEGLPISLYRAFNEYDEARFIVERVQSWADEGGSLKECAILYRSNAQSRVLEEALLSARLPYRVYGGLRFFERAEIKDAMAYLQLLANEDNDSAFERVVNTPTRGIGDRTVEIVRQEARRNGISMWRAAGQVIVSGELTTRAANALRKFQEMILQLRENTGSLPLHELTEQVLENSGLRAQLKKKNTEKDQTRLENLDELVNATKHYTDESLDSDGLSPLQTFLSKTVLDTGEESSHSGENGVQLMTLHSAKGLEFPLIFLCGLEEKLFPHSMSLQDENGLEEERRLCYVGITRAMRQLYISYAEVRRLHGQENYTRPSRFIHEIPAELLEEIRLRSSNQAVYQAPKAPAFAMDSGAGKFRVGQRVMHPKFGEGVILNSEGSGATERVEVHFGHQGSKWLVLVYANLQAVE
ncbi:DNA helicase II [Candidatus Venteria ishoeyi]|uniref:DNA 3'-5' helicase n=1 Tax=Candidatus Venteria ishoeyi TaxID=1899563 RepID=A0A1H6F5K1_9GAMM|nr:DNA helicase II [Candidatus Venteria ishoeyi]MDM8546223.1 DNA helicase II [Candidatus Venteria ishoeyi]SEH04356.1 DNA helicase II [Candidatus Venteria ishoeyi]